MTSETLSEEHQRLGRAVTKLISEHAARLDSAPVTSRATPADLKLLFEFAVFFLQRGDPSLQSFEFATEWLETFLCRDSASEQQTDGEEVDDWFHGL